MVLKQAFYETEADSEKDNQITLAVLRILKNSGKPLTNAGIKVEGVSDEDMPSVLQTLLSEKLIEGSSIKQGLVTVAGYELSAEGERLLEKADGLYPLLRDSEIGKRILEQADGNEGLVPNREIEGFCPARKREMVLALLDRGLLERVRISQGLASSVTFHKMTDEGRRILENLRGRVNPKPDDIVPS